MKKTTLSAEEVIRELITHREHTLDMAEAYYGTQHRTKRYLVSEEDHTAAVKHCRLADCLDYAIHCVKEMNRQGINKMDF